MKKVKEYVINFKFNRSYITAKAWILVKEVNYSFSDAMKQAWTYARNVMRNAIAKRDKKANAVATVTTKRENEAVKSVYVSASNQYDFEPTMKKVTGVYQSTIAR